MKTILVAISAIILCSSCKDETVNPVDGNKNPIDTTSKPLPLDSLTPQERELNYNQMIPIAVGNEWTYECTNGKFETMRIDEVKMMTWDIRLKPRRFEEDTILTLKTYRMVYNKADGQTFYRYYYVTPEGLHRGTYNQNYNLNKRLVVCNYLPANPKRPYDTVYAMDVQILWWNPDFKIEFDGENRVVWDTEKGSGIPVDYDGFFYQRYVKGIGIIQSINSSNGPYPDGELVKYKLK